MTKKIPGHNVRIKRAYDTVNSSDGERILIDRLWPRGIKKENLALADWDKDLAPSSELRKWFDHDPARWQEFRKRYAAELRENEQAFAALHKRAQNGVVTLVYAAHNEEANNAVAMREYLLSANGLADF